MRLFDSHAHLTDERFAPDLTEVLTRAARAGVLSIVTVSSDLEDAGRAVELASHQAEPAIGATVGIHPHTAEAFDRASLERLAELAAHRSVVAIGETGLDYHYQNAPREAQLEAFRAQIALAVELDLPLVVHSRDADDDMSRILVEDGRKVRGVLHCFTGGLDLLKTGLAAGWYVSFSGIVTFASYEDDEIVRSVPDDRLLIETDSPYLAPVPRRGRRNEPAYVAHVAERVAQLRDRSVVDLAELTCRNARRFYALG